MNDKKPRLCEILGVEVGEEFKIKSQKYEHSDQVFQVMPGGRLTTNYVGESSFESLMGGSVICFIALCEMIEHPERIIRQTKSLTYTEQEIAIMRGRVAEGYKWLVRDEDGVLYFYEQQPFVTSRRFGTLLYERNTPYFPQITIENSPVNMEEELNRMGREEE